ncbi:MAG: polyprenyl synthetase family protein [Candidatus Heimdallarchaeota archaeon]
MELKLAFKKTIDNVQRELKKLFKKNGSKTVLLGDFSGIFYDSLDEYLTHGGKRIRPFLVQTAFDAVGGDHSKGNIVRASLALELLHNGSLLHDDVIDKDETRRGKPAFYVKFRNFYQQQVNNESFDKANDFGEAMAIFAGDLCFPYAIECIINSGFPMEARIKALQAFADAFREVIDGVIIETGDATLNTGTEKSYYRMVNLKTGALIRKAVEIGAILGGGSEAQRNALVTYCKEIGIAFQIQDDILGIFGDPEKLGKPIGGDIRENKQTILRIYAMANGSSEQVNRLSELMGSDDITEAEVEEVRKIFRDTGALAFAREKIKEATEKAIQALETAKPPLKEKPKKLFIALAKYLEERKK